MQRAHIVAYLSLPAIAAIAGLGFALRREPVSLDLLASHLLGGYLFYAAPHLAWAGAAGLLKPALRVWHGGFVLASAALLLVAVLSFAPGDPSGLPYQWLLYWPLAALLLLVLLVGWLLVGRPRAAA